jgi:hypothetical protein
VKKGTYAIIADLTFIVLVLSLITLPLHSHAAIVWSDNFDDGNYDGWTLEMGGMTAVNGYLECTSVPLDAPTVIWHESTVNAGTWSADILTIGTGELIITFFWPEESHLRYWLLLDGWDVSLWISASKAGEWVYDPDADDTWIHVDITVDELFNIDVFINGTHAIHHQTLDPIVSCQHFRFLMHEVGQIADNVEVSDTIDIVCTNETCTLQHEGPEPTSTTSEPSPTNTTPAPAPPPPPADIPIEMIALGGGVAVVLVVLVIFMKRR